METTDTIKGNMDRIRKNQEKILKKTQRELGRQIIRFVLMLILFPIAGYILVPIFGWKTFSGMFLLAWATTISLK